MIYYSSLDIVQRFLLYSITKSKFACELNFMIFYYSLYFYLIVKIIVFLNKNAFWITIVICAQLLNLKF